MTRRLPMLFAVLALTACVHAKASPGPQVANSDSPPASVAAPSPVVPKAIQALQVVKKAAPIVAAVATEALASAPAVAVAAAAGGPLAGVLAFFANNPTVTHFLVGLLVAGVVWFLARRGVLTPKRAAEISALTVPIAQSPQVRGFVEGTKTKLDDLGLNVLDKVNEELRKIGATKPAEIALAKSLIDVHAPPAA